MILLKFLQSGLAQYMIVDAVSVKSKFINHINMTRIFELKY